MRPKSMILILIALGCGLIASIGISQVVERGSDDDAADVKTSPIYVAIADIDIAEELNAQRVKLEEWPVDRIPPGAVTTAEQLEGMAPNQRLFAGEPILLGKVMPIEQLTTAARRIKPGHRVISLKVTMETAVSHLIQPGDHVDILAFLHGGRGSIPKAEVILSDVEVFALNDKIIRSDEGGGTIAAKTVSVQVRPEDATKLVFFGAQSTLSLTLRSPDDMADEKTVFDVSGQKTSEVTTNIQSLLPQGMNLPGMISPGKEMQILDGNGDARVFRFNAEGGLPELVSGGEPSVATASPVPPFTKADGGKTPPPGIPEEAQEVESPVHELNMGELQF